MELVYVEGVEGNSLYLNERRIIGPKPWGGGPIIYRWKIKDVDVFREDLQRAWPELFRPNAS